MVHPVGFTVDAGDGRVVVRIAVANPAGGSALYVERKKFAPPPPIRADLFRIVCDGAAVPYIGALAKAEPAAGLADFLEIPQGERIESSLDITRLYAFHPPRRECVIVYSAFHGVPNDPSGMVEFTSPPVEFRIAYKPLRARGVRQAGPAAR